VKGALPADIESRVFSVEETAELLGIGRGSAYAAIRRGELPGVRLGRRLVVPGAALLRMLEAAPASGNGGPSPPV
jgi:excisionase family DNA binding protein